MKDLFDNDVWLYETNADNSARFVLGEKGDNPLVCIGVNPSTAEPGKLDNTLRRVKSFSKALGFDGWIMLNLYPQRATDPNDLDDEINRFIHYENGYQTRKAIFDYAEVHVWAAWGVSIEKKPYLKKCLESLIEGTLHTNIKWIHLGELTQAGHPRHPLYLPIDAEVQEFNVVKYLKDLEAGK